MANIIDAEIAELKSLFEEIDTLGPESSEVEGLLTEAESTIKQIKIQSHSVANQTKKDAIIVQIAEYEAKAKAVKKSLLMAGGTKSSQAAKPVDQAEQSQQSMDILQKARRELLETEAVGTNVLSNLAQQKETIAHANANLKESNQHLSYSKKLINNMSQWWRWPDDLFSQKAMPL